MNRPISKISTMYHCLYNTSSPICQIHSIAIPLNVSWVTGLLIDDGSEDPLNWMSWSVLLFVVRKQTLPQYFFLAIIQPIQAHRPEFLSLLAMSFLQTCSPFLLDIFQSFFHDLPFPILLTPHYAPSLHRRYLDIVTI